MGDRGRGGRGVVADLQCPAAAVDLDYDFAAGPAADLAARVGAVAFFLYDVPKILLLLSGMIFLITIVRTFFSAERTRALLGGKRQGIGNVLAAVLGIVTPFCSCSAVPLFIGFVESGIPLGVTFSFLIAAPMINEVAVVMLFGLFGWQVAALYIVTGLVDRHRRRAGHRPPAQPGALRRGLRVADAGGAARRGRGEQHDLAGALRHRPGRATQEIVGKVWPYVVVGIAVGAVIHGYVPEDALAGIMGKQAWWSVPAAVLLGRAAVLERGGHHPDRRAR